VHHATETTHVRFGEQPERVLLRLPGVDGDGQPELGRQLQLGGERLALTVGWRQVVVIVEADLSDGHDRIQRGQPAQFGGRRRGPG